MNYQINMFAVLVAGIAHMGFGAVWYRLWQKRWTILVLHPDVSAENTSTSNSNYAIAMLNALIVAYVLSQVVAAVGPSTFFQFITVGATCWFGFVATTMLTTTLFARRPKSLFLIDSIYYLISFMLISGIYAYWL